MLKRKKRGSINTESPADVLRKFFSGLIIKFLFCIVLSVAVYFFFNYFLINFINFLIENVIIGVPFDKNNTYFLVAMIFAIVVANYIVFKDRLRKR